MMRLPKRSLCLVLAISLAVDEAAFAAIAEPGIWQERRDARALPRLAAPTAAPVSPIASTVLDALPPPARTGPSDRRVSVPASLQSLVDAVPLTHATLRDVQEGRAGVPPVIVVEDVHLNPEAQANIGNVLMGLIDARAVAMVGIEGAFEHLPFAPLRALRAPDGGKTVAAVAQSFLENGALGAPSWTGLVSTLEPPPFVGVDDRAAYARNVDAYLASRRLKPDVTRRLTALTARLERKKKTVYSEELRAFDRRRSAYHLGAVGLGEHAAALAALTDRRSPDVDAFLQAQAIESQLDFRKVENERRAVVAKLAPALNGSETAELLARTVAYKTGRLSAGDYQDGFRRLCERKRVALGETPAFERYLRYVILTDGINAARLMTEIDQMELEAFARLAVTDDQKRLGRDSEIALLLGKLADFSLTPDEWKRFEQIRSGATGDVAALAAVMGPSETFYRSAETRSRAMVDRLVAWKGADGGRALVTGGFHTPEVAALLRERGIPYVVVSPKLTRVDLASGSGYLSVFDREKTPLDRLFGGERLFVNPTTVVVTDRGLLLRLFSSVRYALTGNRITRFLRDGVAYQLTLTPGRTPAENLFRLSVAPTFAVLTVVAAQLLVPQLGIGVSSLFGTIALFVVGISPSAARAMRGRLLSTADGQTAPLSDADVARKALDSLRASTPGAGMTIDAALTAAEARLRISKDANGFFLRLAVPLLVRLSEGDPVRFAALADELSAALGRSSMVDLGSESTLRVLLSSADLLAAQPGLWNTVIAEIGRFNGVILGGVLHGLLARSLTRSDGATAERDLEQAGTLRNLPLRAAGDDVAAFSLTKGERMDEVRQWEDGAGDRVLDVSEGELAMVRLRPGARAVIHSAGHITCWAIDIRATDKDGGDWLGHAHIFSTGEDADPQHVSRQLDNLLARLAEMGITSAKMTLAVNLASASLDRFSKTPNAGRAAGLAGAAAYLAANPAGIAISVETPVAPTRLGEFISTLTSQDGVSIGVRDPKRRAYTVTRRAWTGDAATPPVAVRAVNRARPFSLVQNLRAVFAAGLVAAVAAGLGFDLTGHVMVSLYAVTAVLAAHLAVGLWIRSLFPGSDSPFFRAMIESYFGPDVRVLYRPTETMSRPDYLEETDPVARTVMFHEGWVRLSSNPFLNLARLLVLPIVLAHAGSRLWRIPAPAIYLFKPVHAVYAPLRLLARWLAGAARPQTEDAEGTIFQDFELPSDITGYKPIIQTPPSPDLDVAVVVPIYNELGNGNIFRLLRSFLDQDAAPATFELILVVNNTPEAAAAQTAERADNRRLLQLIAYLNAPVGAPMPVWLRRQPPDRRALVDAMRARGLRIHAIDRSTEGMVRNMGFIRSSGVNEAVERLDSIGKPDAMVASLDGDTTVPPHYISRLRELMNQPSVEAVFTNIEFEYRGGEEFSMRTLFFYWTRRLISQLGSALAVARPNAVGGPQIVARARVFRELGAFGEVPHGEDGNFAKLVALGNNVIFADDITVRSQSRVAQGGFDSGRRFNDMRAAGTDAAALAPYLRSPTLNSLRLRYFYREVHALPLELWTRGLTPQVRELMDFYGIPADAGRWQRIVMGSNSFSEITTYVERSGLPVELTGRAAVGDFITNFAARRLPGSIARWETVLAAFSDADRRDMARFQDGARELIARVRANPSADLSLPAGAHPALRAALREPWFAGRLRSVADTAVHPTAADSYAALAEIFPDWLLPFENTPIRRDLVTLRAFEAFQAQARHRPSVDPEMHNFLRRFGGDDITVLDGSAPQGGILLWVRSALFPFLSPTVYARWAFLIENALVGVLVALPVGLVLFGVTGDVAFAVRSANVAAWAVFAVAHIPAVAGRISSDPASAVNAGYASLIAAINIALGFSSITGGIDVLVLAIASVVVHWAVNVAAAANQMWRGSRQVLFADATTARRGLSLLALSAEKAPPALRERLLHVQIARVFSGVIPEVDLPADPTNRSLADFINGLGSPVGARVIEATGELRLVNRTSAVRVIRANADLFPPEAVRNPEAWLSTFFLGAVEDTLDHTNPAAYGLLSGFPRSAVDSYVPWQSAVTRLEQRYPDIAGRLTLDERAAVLFYMKHPGMEPSPFLRTALEKTGILSAEEVGLLLRLRRSSEESIAFLSFSDADLAWGHALSALFLGALATEGRGLLLDWDDAETVALIHDDVPATDDIRQDLGEELAVHLALYVRDGNLPAALDAIETADQMFKSNGNTSWATVAPLFIAELRRQVGEAPSAERRQRLAELIPLLSSFLSRTESTAFVASLEEVIQTRIASHEAVLRFVDSTDPAAALADARALVDGLADGESLRGGNRIALVYPEGNRAAGDALKADPAIRRLMALGLVDVVSRMADTTLSAILHQLEASPGWAEQKTVRLIVRQGTELPPAFFDLPATDPRRVVLDIILTTLPGVVEMSGTLMRNFQSLHLALIAA